MAHVDNGVRRAPDSHSRLNRPVMANDLTAGDGDLGGRGVLVPPDRVAAGGQPLVHRRVPGPAQPGPGQTSGQSCVPLPPLPNPRSAPANSNNPPSERPGPEAGDWAPRPGAGPG